MKQYLSLLKEILNDGNFKKDRTGIGTIAKFGTQKRYDLTKGFPLITTKKIHFKSVVHELLWFIKGDTNIKYLVDHDVKIWNEWPYEIYKKSKNFQKETLSEFVQKIKEDHLFAQKHGNLGPIYGKQWRNFGSVDQLQKIVDDLKNHTFSRRLILSAWNPSEISNMVLPPCHAFVQFFVQDNRLSCQMYQRSADAFLGVPFNIASYALLTHMLAQVSNLQIGEFIHTTGDTHIYLNHLDNVKLQLTRKPKKLPQIHLNSQISDLFAFTYDDISLINYDYHPLIKGEVAI